MTNKVENRKLLKPKVLKKYSRNKVLKRTNDKLQWEQKR